MTAVLIVLTIGMIGVAALQLRILFAVRKFTAFTLREETAMADELKDNLDVILARVSNQSNVIDSVVTLLAELSIMLKAVPVSEANKAEIAQIITMIDGNSTRAASAVVANTPATDTTSGTPPAHATNPPPPSDTGGGGSTGTGETTGAADATDATVVSGDGGSP